ncbi:biotin--[acetyl-CoA-carboxylase] ligase [Dehalococcoides mccartyi]|uniref:biotin--[acetyl-CoA-carboxylase] ligase n=1 Tax=Dehalococcoides mccartyi TaxID=61435 RepID=UPI0003C88E6A|nr:biotin--[acetyl-CoA-carboxylase] ligase [Dehalococcoides mccartyi]AHB13543.1 biotin-[acetyl-CoA-carboxylase] ligase / BirA family transcriptional regulator [Dehalococcoides mccartyi GY50]AII57929.1 biotin-(acetyl-CoA carboxylase) ligase [Dehalococcoides mccartyi CG1]APH12446.1 biotin--acetyl-CoA-carboxylase ligase [Dehalococcoides mccartyi]
MSMSCISINDIRNNLHTCFMGREIIYLPETASTQTVAMDMARKGAEAGTVIITERQTEGHGRLKRLWLSPQGNIYMSFILHPNQNELSRLIMAASLAVSFAIEDTTGIMTELKWPNDILIKGKKVCGMLIENDIRDGQVNSSAVGLGINVNTDMQTYPELRDIATSLINHTGKPVSREKLILGFLHEFERLYLYLKEHGECVFEMWKKRLITLGKEVDVTSGRDIYRGIVETVNPDGSLRIRLADGNLVHIMAGDVSLRHAD